MARLEMTIKSRLLDRDVTFSIPGDSYIFVDLNGQPGTLGDQLCLNGELTGYTVVFEGDDEAAFQRICRRWLKNHLKKYKEILY